MATSSTLSQTQRYAAGALLALALRQAQIHQRVLLGSHGLDEGPDPATAVLSNDDPDGRDLWTHDSRGLLRPVLRSPLSPLPLTCMLRLSIRPVMVRASRFNSQVSRDRPQGLAGRGEDGGDLRAQAPHWSRTCQQCRIVRVEFHPHFDVSCDVSSRAQFLRKVFEDEDDGEKAAADRSDLELALAKAVDAMAMGLENDVAPGDLFKQHVFSGNNDEPADDASPWSPGGGGRSKDYRKMAVLYMLLSACVADVNMGEDGMGSPRIRKGYDARHRVALRLIATWLDVKWIKMVTNHHSSRMRIMKQHAS